PRDHGAAEADLAGRRAPSTGAEAAAKRSRRVPRKVNESSDGEGPPDVAAHPVPAGRGHLSRGARTAARGGDGVRRGGAAGGTRGGGGGPAVPRGSRTAADPAGRVPGVLPGMGREVLVQADGDARCGAAGGHGAGTASRGRGR